MLELGWPAWVTTGVVVLALVGLVRDWASPALVLLASSWLPDELVTRAVGWQLAAASAGAIVAAAVLGVIADRSGLASIVVGITVLVALLAGAQIAIEVATRSTQSSVGKVDAE